MALERPEDPDQLRVRVGHRLGEVFQILRGARAADHILTLGVGEKVT